MHQEQESSQGCSEKSLFSSRTTGSKLGPWAGSGACLHLPPGEQCLLSYGGRSVKTPLQPPRVTMASCFQVPSSHHTLHPEFWEAEPQWLLGALGGAPQTFPSSSWEAFHCVNCLQFGDHCSRTSNPRHKWWSQVFVTRKERHCGWNVKGHSKSRSLNGNISDLTL